MGTYFRDQILRRETTGLGICQVQKVKICFCPRWNAFERCSPFVLSFFSCEVAVGVGGSDDRDQSAPTKTAPQQVGFGSDRDCGVDKVSRSSHDDDLG